MEDFKAQTVGIGDGGAYVLGHENHNSNDFDLGEEQSFCIFLLFG